MTHETETYTINDSIEIFVIDFLKWEVTISFY